MKYVALPFLVFAALVSLSDSSRAATYDVKNQAVTNLATGWGGEGFYVNTQGQLPDGANCGDGNRFILEPNTLMQKEMVALLLMVMQNGQKAELHVGWLQ